MGVCVSLKLLSFFLLKAISVLMLLFISFISRLQASFSPNFIFAYYVYLLKSFPFVCYKFPNNYHSIVDGYIPI